MKGVVGLSEFQILKAATTNDLTSYRRLSLVSQSQAAATRPLYSSRTQSH